MTGLIERRARTVLNLELFMSVEQKLNRQWFPRVLVVFVLDEDPEAGGGATGQLLKDDDAAA